MKCTTLFSVMIFSALSLHVYGMQNPTEINTEQKIENLEKEVENLKAELNSIYKILGNCAFTTNINYKRKLDILKIPLILIACKEGNKTLVEKLICKNPEVIHESCENGKTGLHMAAKYGHLNIVKLLVNNKADINSKTFNYKRTPLDFACEKKHEHIKTFLEQKGAEKTSILT